MRNMLITRDISEYNFYADALSLTSTRNGTKLTAMQFVKCRRVPMVCLRICILIHLYLLYSFVSHLLTC